METVGSGIASRDVADIASVADGEFPLFVKAAAALSRWTGPVPPIGPRFPGGME